jgi:hypothetical protein
LEASRGFSPFMKGEAEVQLRALEALRRGCLTGGALALLFDVSADQARHALARLWREGRVRRYMLGPADVWCLDGPSAIGVLCNGRVVYITVRRVAKTATALIQSGTRALRPAALAQLNGVQCNTHLGLVRAILAASLDGCAVEDRRSGRHMLLITDPACAAERLQRLAETGALPLEPDPPPPPPQPQPLHPFRRMVAYVPRKMLEELDGLVRRGIFPNRSEAMRAAIRELLERYRP